MTIEGQTTFIKACKDFFGMVTGPGLVAEFQALTAKDKRELHDELVREGYDLVPAEYVERNDSSAVQTPALVGV